MRAFARFVFCLILACAAVFGAWLAGANVTKEAAVGVLGFSLFMTAFTSYFDKH